MTAIAILTGLSQDRRRNIRRKCELLSAMGVGIKTPDSALDLFYQRSPDAAFIFDSDRETDELTEKLLKEVEVQDVYYQDAGGWHLRSN